MACRSCSMPTTRLTRGRAGRRIHGCLRSVPRSRVAWPISCDGYALTALRREPRDVTHLAPWPDLGLAIEVQLGAGLAQERPPVAHIVADQVLHYRVGMPFG